MQQPPNADGRPSAQQHGIIFGNTVAKCKCEHAEGADSKIDGIIVGKQIDDNTDNG